MDIENPLALHYMMQDDLFFLKEDRQELVSQVTEVPVMQVVKEEIPVQATPAKPDLIYMGKKGIMLILVHYTDQEFIHETHLSALENILKRKDIAINDVAILNIAKNNGVDMKELLAYFDPNRILILGGNALPGGIGQQILNQPKQAGNRTLLYSFSFDEMMDSPENKKAFWEQMKNF